LVCRFVAECLNSLAMGELHGGNGILQSRRRTVRFALMATLASLLLGVLLARLVLGGFNPTDPDRPHWSIIVGEAFIVVPLVLIVWQRRLPLVSSLRLGPVPLAVLPGAVLIGLGAAILIDELDRLMALVFPLPERVTQAMDFLVVSDADDVVLILLGAVAIAPVAEEMIFRGFFQGQLERGLRDATRAVLLSAALFMALHFMPWWSLQLYVLGVLLGYLAWRTGSIWPAVMVHGINNLLAVWFANQGEDNPAWYYLGRHVSPVWLAVAAASVYVGFRVVLAVSPPPFVPARHSDAGNDNRSI
jgi:membrane protease YdiL (CAAX protease family)